MIKILPVINNSNENAVFSNCKYNERL